MEGRGAKWLEAIPPLSQDITETPTRIGDYVLGNILGEGQFALVRAIERRRTTTERHKEVAQGNGSEMHGGGSLAEQAAKIVNKAGVVSLTTLRRVDNEIAVLRLLDHDGVMRLHEVR